MAVTALCNRDCTRRPRGQGLCGSLLLFFFFLGHGISLGADSRDALQKAADLVQQGRLEEADARQGYRFLRDDDLYLLGGPEW